MLIFNKKSLKEDFIVMDCISLLERVYTEAHVMYLDFVDDVFKVLNIRFLTESVEFAYKRDGVPEVVIVPHENIHHNDYKSYLLVDGYEVVIMYQMLKDLVDRSPALKAQALARRLPKLETIDNVHNLEEFEHMLSSSDVYVNLGDVKYYKLTSFKRLGDNLHLSLEDPFTHDKCERVLSTEAKFTNTPAWLRIDDCFVTLFIKRAVTTTLNVFN